MANKKLNRCLRYGFFAFVVSLILTIIIPPFFRYVLGGREIVDTLEYKWSKSDQPERDHLPKGKKWIVKISYADSFLKVIFINIKNLPLVIKNYFYFKDIAYKKNVLITDEHFSVAVSLDAIDVYKLKKYTDELGIRHVLIRVPYYKGKVFSHMNKEKIKKGIIYLAQNGIDVVISIPQSREAVNDRDSWKAHIKETFDAFSPYCKYFIIGHTPNRGKWGIWDFGMNEYKSLFGTAREVAREYKGIKLIGPSIIDFEWEYMLAILDSLHSDDIDIVNSLLYVDGKGAPENKQMGFNTSDKVTLIYAVANIYSQGIPLWITEVNWPLKGQEEYSPAGGGVSEENYANFLVRYNTLVTCSGFVERIYWWQLIAKGYGLIDSTSGHLRKRPALYTLKTLRSQLIGSTYLSRISDGNYYVFTFKKGKEFIHLMWTTGKKVKMQFPEEGRVVTRDGLDIGYAKTLIIGEEPIYVHIPAS
jgi:hypothetical protein